MGSKRRINYNLLAAKRSAPWLLSNYERANGLPKGSVVELTPIQILKVMGLPVPLLTIEFATLPPLRITTWNKDIEVNGVIFRSSADLISGGRVTSTTELHNDGNSYKLSGIRPEMLTILNSPELKNAKVIQQAAILTPDGDVSFVLDIDAGIIANSTVDIEPLMGTSTITLKTDSIYKRLEGVAGTRLASSTQKALFPDDTSFDNINTKLKQQLTKTVLVGSNGTNDGARYLK